MKREGKSYDAGEDPDTGLCYIIMDYMPGGTLADMIKARGQIPVGDAVKIARCRDFARRVAVLRSSLGRFERRRLYPERVVLLVHLAVGYRA